VSSTDRTNHVSIAWVEQPRAAIAELIESVERGDSAASETLFASLYAELHRIAKSQLTRHGGGVTLGATTLLHEAYLALSAGRSLEFPDEGRFLGYAARVMRGLIIDYARARSALKRGGAFEITQLGDQIDDAANAEELEQIGVALEKLASVEQELAVLVDLKFFCGFSLSDIARMRGYSLRTAQRNWEKARIFLHRHADQGSPLLIRGAVPRSDTRNS
jgi:RNA polymerase sigma factor (TIGR02999 family)